MHPCCNGSLQTGTKIIAIVELVLSILICLLGVFTFSFGGILTAVGLSDDEDEETTTSPEDKKDAAIAGVAVMLVSVILILIGALYLLIAVILLLGAVKRNRTLCMVWFVINAVLVLLTVIEMFRDIISYKEGSAISTFFGILLQSYFFWVVWAFMAELKEEAAMSPYSHPKPRA